MITSATEVMNKKMGKTKRKDKKEQTGSINKFGYPRKDNDA